MKPFNLERALAGDPVVTRDGREVKDLHYLETAKNNQKVVAVVAGVTHFFSSDGSYYSSECEYSLDLFMTGIKKTGWINVYVGPLAGGCIYKSFETAHAIAGPACIATAKVEWEE